MRTLIALTAIASTILACSGSTTTTSDTGAATDGAAGGSSSGAAGGSSSGTAGGSSGGSTTCASLNGAYSLVWTQVSGGTTCPLFQPKSQMESFDGGTGIPSMSDPDAGVNCTTTQSGCSASVSCNIIEPGDAGGGQVSQSFNVASNGNLTGTETVSLTITSGGQTQTIACSFALVGTKQ